MFRQLEALAQWIERPPPKRQVTRSNRVCLIIAGMLELADMLDLNPGALKSVRVRAPLPAVNIKTSEVLMNVSPAQFESLLLPAFQFLERSEIVNDALTTIFGQVPQYGEEANRLCDAYLDLVALTIGLDDAEVLSWFAYENEFGKAEKSYNGTKISSVSALYDYLVPHQK